MLKLNKKRGLKIATNPKSLKTCTHIGLTHFWWFYLKLREAIVYQIGCFFTHCVKGGDGVKPMCKNLCCRFVSF